MIHFYEKTRKEKVNKLNILRLCSRGAKCFQVSHLGHLISEIHFSRLVLTISEEKTVLREPPGTTSAFYHQRVLKANQGRDSANIKVNTSVADFSRFLLEPRVN